MCGDRFSCSHGAEQQGTASRHTLKKLGVAEKQERGKRERMMGRKRERDEREREREERERTMKRKTKERETERVGGREREG